MHAWIPEGVFMTVISRNTHQRPLASTPTAAAQPARETGRRSRRFCKKMWEQRNERVEVSSETGEAAPATFPWNAEKH